MGFVVILALLVGAVWVVIKSNLAYSWHNRGVGERKGKANYGRIKRESPDSADAQLTEAEFVDRFVSAKPGVARYVLAAVALMFAMPISCVAIL